MIKTVNPVAVLNIIVKEHQFAFKEVMSYAK
jgi:hypothetical protein